MFFSKPFKVSSFTDDFGKVRTPDEMREFEENYASQHQLMDAYDVYAAVKALLYPTEVTREDAAASLAENEYNELVQSMQQAGIHFFGEEAENNDVVEDGDVEDPYRDPIMASLADKIMKISLPNKNFNALMLGAFKEFADEHEYSYCESREDDDGPIHGSVMNGNVEVASIIIVDVSFDDGKSIDTAEIKFCGIDLGVPKMNKQKLILQRMGFSPDKVKYQIEENGVKYYSPNTRYGNVAVSGQVTSVGNKRLRRYIGTGYIDVANTPVQKQEEPQSNDAITVVDGSDSDGCNKHSIKKGAKFLIGGSIIAGTIIAYLLYRAFSSDDSGDDE